MVWIGLLMLLASQAPTGDIDAFMEKVLEQRDVNWDQYYNYFCKERTELVVEGALPGVPLSGFRREYLWFVRDGYVVRSPVYATGVGLLLYGVNHEKHRYFKVREENVYSKVKSRMSSWLGEIF